jgi:hypothetical protein
MPVTLPIDSSLKQQKMRNQIFSLGALLLLVISVSCEKQEQAELLTRDYFITKDLSFLNEGLSGKGVEGWPANGCKDIDVKLKLGFIEAETTVTHCCVNYVCNIMAMNRIIDFFLGDKSGKDYPEIEIISSEIVNLNQYDIRIHPGMYQLDMKTKGLRDLEYEVWARTP